MFCPACIGMLCSVGTPPPLLPPRPNKNPIVLVHCLAESLNLKDPCVCEYSFCFHFLIIASGMDVINPISICGIKKTRLTFSCDHSRAKIIYYLELHHGLSCKMLLPTTISQRNGNHVLSLHHT